MRKYLAERYQLVLLLLSWVVAAQVLPAAVMVLVPITIILLRQKEDWAGVLMCMLVVLALSDVRKDIPSMAYFKTVKNICVVLMAGFFLIAQRRFVPQARVFPIFLPFFLYSAFPLLFSPDLSTGVQKTISYALIFLVVPNYVLFCYRSRGWEFFRHLIFLIVLLLLSGLVLRFVSPNHAFVGGRFHGVFGNPNGLAIFCLLAFMLVTVLITVNKYLFSRWEMILIYAMILYCLILSGSRGSLAAVVIYLTIQRFFSYSPVIGLMVMLAFMAVIEVVTSNIGAIITSLGLEEYFRLHTLEEGSGRYFAWEFAWQRIQEYFFFGGGFATDETVMRRYYRYLERMGHQGGVHNSYLSMWFNVGIVGLIIYFRSFVLLFIKAAKQTRTAMAVLFATLFSINYESWLVGSLNPYTIMLLIIMTVISEPEITQGALDPAQDADPTPDGEASVITDGMTPPAIGPGVTGRVYFAPQRLT